MRICLTEIEPLRSFGGQHGIRGHINRNIHIHIMVFELIKFKSEVKIGLLLLLHARL